MIFRHPFRTRQVRIAFLLAIFGVRIAAGQSDDPDALLQKASHELVLHGKRQTLLSDLSKAIQLYREKHQVSANYGEALALNVLLQAANGKSSSPQLKQLADEAVRVYKSLAPNAPGAALAYETAAEFASDAERDSLLADALQLRAASVRSIPADPSFTAPKAVAGKGNSDVRLPTLAKKVEPKYTALTLQARLECNPGVLLATVIDANGIPGEFELKRSCGFGFDEAAARALREWRFHPAVDSSGHRVAYAATSRSASDSCSK